MKEWDSTRAVQLQFLCINDNVSKMIFLANAIASGVESVWNNGRLESGWKQWEVLLE